MEAVEYSSESLELKKRNHGLVKVSLKNGTGPAFLYFVSVIVDQEGFSGDVETAAFTALLLPFLQPAAILGTKEDMPKQPILGQEN